MITSGPLDSILWWEDIAGIEEARDRITAFGTSNLYLSVLRT